MDELDPGRHASPEAAAAIAVLLAVPIILLTIIAAAVYLLWPFGRTGT